MAEITTTQAFSDGDTVTATKLNNITANAAIQTEAITNRSAETTVDQANDLLLMYDASATALKKISLSNVIKAGTASNFPVTGNATIGGTLGVTGNVSVNTNKFNVTAASGNTTIAGTLGVSGDATLSGNLSVTGNSVVKAGTASAPAIVPTGDTNTGIFFPAADTIAFSEGGTESMRIDSSGRVGIGMTPAALLDISKSDNTGSVSDFPALRVTNTNSTQGNGTSTYNYARIDVKSGNGTVFGAFGTRHDSLYSGAYIGTESSHPVFFQTGGTERLRIDSSGNVGIGVTSPAVKLDVSNGNIQGKEILLQNGAASSPALGTTPSWYSPASGVAALSTNAFERLRITSGGEVCVGRTSSGAKLHIYNSGSTDARVTYLEKASGTTDGLYLVCYAGVTTHFQILGNGNCQNANNSYGAVSDEKIKQDIVDASTQWNDVKNLRVRKFRFKSDPSMPLQIGLVAQEVELVSPHLVEETKDTDRDGNDLGTTTKGVKYSVLYMKAVKALQEAMERIEQLEAKVAALEAA